MTTTVDERLQEVIEAYVRDRFADTPIDAVRIERDYSADGDDIVNVTVVFGKPPRSIQIGNLTRTLWEKLALRNEAAMFPIFSFLTREENARLSAAA